MAGWRRSEQIEVVSTATNAAFSSGSQERGHGLANPGASPIRYIRVAMGDGVVAADMPTAPEPRGS